MLSQERRDKEERLAKELDYQKGLYQTAVEGKKRLKADQSNALSVSWKRARSLSRAITVFIMVVFSDVNSGHQHWSP